MDKVSFNQMDCHILHEQGVLRVAFLEDLGELDGILTKKLNSLSRGRISSVVSHFILGAVGALSDLLLRHMSLDLSDGDGVRPFRAHSTLKVLP